MARKSQSSRRSRSSSSFTMPDMSKVEGASVIPADEYRLRVVDVEESEGDKGPYLKWTFEVAEGKFEGKKPKAHITSFAPEALFNLKGVLTALGVDIPEEEFDIDKKELIDLECMGTIEHDTYQGRKQSVIVDFFEIEDDGDKKSSRKKDADEGDDRRSSRRGGKKDEPEKLSADEINDMSQEELEDVVEQHEFDVDLSKIKTVSKMRAAVIEAAEAADVLDGDEEEEEKEDDRPSRRGKEGEGRRSSRRSRR